MTKHTPATPLPWNRNETAEDCTIVKGGRNHWIASCPWEQKDYGDKRQSDAAKDAAYIVHACNAYPSIVKALRACCAAIEASEAYEMERTGEYDAMPEPSRDSAEQLLRSLGEL